MEDLVSLVGTSFFFKPGILSAREWKWVLRNLRSAAKKNCTEIFVEEELEFNGCGSLPTATIN